MSKTQSLCRKTGRCLADIFVSLPRSRLLGDPGLCTITSGATRERKGIGGLYAGIPLRWHTVYQMGDFFRDFFWWSLFEFERTLFEPLICQVIKFF